MMEAKKYVEAGEVLPGKVLQLYQAVLELMEEGAEMSTLRVSSITERAGIGKGTAYEYFSSREEIVASAIVYHVRKSMQALKALLETKTGFREQLDWILDEMGKEDGRILCYLRTIHILTDNSDFSKLIRQMLETEGYKEDTPVGVIETIVKKAVETGELRADLPTEYMTYLFVSHLMTYIVTMTVENRTFDSETMKGFVRQGILNELCK